MLILKNAMSHHFCSFPLLLEALALPFVFSPLDQDKVTGFSYSPIRCLSLGWLKPDSSSTMDLYPEQKGLSRGGCASPGSGTCGQTHSSGCSLCRSGRATWGKTGV